MAEFILWFSLAIVVYVYAGLPVVLFVAGTVRKRTVRSASVTPSISLIIAAYNEQKDIRRRLENALASDYPADKLEVIVASDGSSDGTENIVRQFAGRNVKLLALQRQGKIHALNAAAASACGEILVFSDATSMFNRAALRHLARNFADPEVGGVCGRPEFLVKGKCESTASSEQLYFRYDTFLKQMESLSGNVVSSAGCIHAVRRDLYEPIPTYVTDDFSISTAVIERGKRLVFEPDAIAYEEPAAASDQEFQRKVRMMTRGFRSLIFRKALLNPFRFGFYSVVLFSHKLLRRIIPIFLLLAFFAAMSLSTTSVAYKAIFIGQAFFYVLAIAGLTLTGHRVGRMKIFCIPFYYCVGNAAALVALGKVLCGARIELWQPQRETGGGD